MDVVGSPSSVCSAVSVDRSRDVASRRSRRRQRPTSTDQAETNNETIPPAAGGSRTASWSANFDNLLRDCAGLATFSVSDQSDQITSLFTFGCVFCVNCVTAVSLRASFIAICHSGDQLSLVRGGLRGLSNSLYLSHAKKSRLID